MTNVNVISSTCATPAMTGEKMTYAFLFFELLPETAHCLTCSLFNCSEQIQHLISLNVLQGR